MILAAAFSIYPAEWHLAQTALECAQLNGSVVTVFVSHLTDSSQYQTQTEERVNLESVSRDPNTTAEESVRNQSITKGVRYTNPLSLSFLALW